MYYKEASKYVQMRFKRQGFCMICKNRITDIESFEYIAVPMGKFKYYNFFHTSCLTHRTRIADVIADYESLVDQQGV